MVIYLLNIVECLVTFFEINFIVHIEYEEYSNLYLLYIVYHLRIQYYFLLFY